MGARDRGRPRARVWRRRVGVCVPAVLWRRRDVDDRRDEARRRRAPRDHARGSGRLRRLFSLSPQARKAFRGRRARHRMVGAPGGIENLMTHWLGLPPLASAHGGQIDSLIGWTHIFMFILFVGWGGFFLYALFRFRKSRNPVANYTGVKSHASSYSEVAVAGIE